MFEFTYSADLTDVDNAQSDPFKEASEQPKIEDEMATNGPLTRISMLENY